MYVFGLKSTLWNLNHHKDERPVQGGGSLKSTLWNLNPIIASSITFRFRCLKSTLWNLNFILVVARMFPRSQSEIYLVEFKQRWILSQ